MAVCFYVHRYHISPETQSTQHNEDKTAEAKEPQISGEHSEKLKPAIERFEQHLRLFSTKQIKDVKVEEMEKKRAKKLFIIGASHFWKLSSKFCESPTQFSNITSNCRIKKILSHESKHPQSLLDLTMSKFTLYFLVYGSYILCITLETKSNHIVF